MKTAIHPTYYPDAKIVCACGNVIEVGSTVKEIHVELCSACHPFYTGKLKLIDTARRVEKFVGKVKAKETKGSTSTGKKVKTVKRAALKAAKKAAKKPTRLDETEA
ncbi:50S ribosomal protein L31 [Candidatus Uhrbacteria bacterium]|nr:50S ribosomal protein L31 [Candidatus Uhrbacteria bacterium]